MNPAILLIPMAALLLAGQAPSPPPARRIVVRDGDTIVIPAGVNARVDRSRDGEARLVLSSRTREVVLLFDEARPGSPPDGQVDRVYRLGLQEEFPQQFLYRGPARLEDFELITDGESQRRGYPAIVTPAGRLYFAGMADESSPAGEAVVIPTTRGESRMLTNPSWRGSRAFDDVEHLWVNHLENEASAARMSLSLSAAASMRETRGSASPDGQPTAAIRAEEYRDSPAFVVPRVLREVKPQYTADAMRRGVHGLVGLDVTVQTDGTTTNIRVVRSLDPDLDQACIDALRQWRFAPGRLDGRAVPVIVTVDLTFALNRD